MKMRLVSSLTTSLQNSGSILWHGLTLLSLEANPKVTEVYSPLERKLNFIGGLC
jgi:hypothetical protein